jgi:sarcosine oxidase subunit gamma
MSETRLTEPDAPGMVTLRADLADLAVAAALETAFGATLGATIPPVRRIAGGLAGGAAWMAPDELLLFVPRTEAAARAAALDAALEGTHRLVADVSDARAAFRITGPGAREVIAKGAPVDLHPAAFRPGDLRRTRLGQVACAFWIPEAAPATIELVVFRSVAAFVAQWLATAAAPGTLPGHLPPG